MWEGKQNENISNQITEQQSCYNKQILTITSRYEILSMIDYPPDGWQRQRQQQQQQQQQRNQPCKLS